MTHCDATFPITLTCARVRLTGWTRHNASCVTRQFGRCAGLAELRRPTCALAHRAGGRGVVKSSGSSPLRNHLLSHSRIYYSGERISGRRTVLALPLSAGGCCWRGRTGRRALCGFAKGLCLTSHISGRGRRSGEAAVHG